ncbi:MAG: hypothetical protein H7222_07800 [Methylotenera sp.]|nr:hypothetical protein [Oligoflexia bacterium]
MTRLFLSAINAPALILLAALGVAIQSSLFNSYPLQYLQPDIILVFIIWFGLKRGFGEGGILTLILANIAEIHSAAPQGVFLVTYMTLYLLIRSISRLFVIPNLSALIILTLGASIYSKLACLGVLHLLGLSGNQWQHTLLLLLPGSVMAGLSGIWIYRWLEQFDLVTFKNERTRSALENELQLESDRF